MEFGQRLQELLYERHLKPAALARFLGTNQTTVSGWIHSGRSPSFEYILPICEFLEVDPYLLLTGKAAPTPKDDLSEDRRMLLQYYNLLSDFEKGELVAELRIKTRDRKKEMLA